MGIDSRSNLIYHYVKMASRVVMKASHPVASLQAQGRAPMYFRIQLDILGQLERGALQPGDLLPSEADLSKKYRVSRITAKRALDELVRQGRAFRQQGKGTFVARERIREISGFRSFSQDILARGLAPSSRVLTFKEITPEAQLRERLNLAEGEKAFLLKRLRLASGDPVAVETAYVNARLCPGLLSQDFSRASLYKILIDQYRVIPTWADAELEAATASRQDALLLRLKVGQPVLIARRLTFAANYDVIETVHSVYRGDRFTFYTGRQNIV
jgi:GntR family transcriptional regulator